MYIYTFESKLSSENYLVFSSLLKFISLLLPLWPKIMIYSFWNPGHNSSKDKQSYLLIHRVEKNKCWWSYYSNVRILQKSFGEKIFFQRLEETIQQTINSFLLLFHFFANLRVLCQTKAFKFQSFNLFSKGKMDNCLLSLIRYKKSLKEYVLFLLFNGMEKWS